MNERECFLEIEGRQICKAGQNVCGDVFISRRMAQEDRVVTVLSDGLGSGIKAGVLVHEGSGAHVFDIGSTHTTGSFFIYEHEEKTLITNHSSNPLYMQQRFHTWRHDGEDVGYPILTFSGSGDFVIGELSTFRLELGAVLLDTQFTGTMYVEEGAYGHPRDGMFVEGGTLVWDGWHSPRWGADLVVGGAGVTATLSGNGEFRASGSSHILRNYIYDKGVVNPGRPGETGALTFYSFDLPFYSGSELHLDLRAPHDHDQLLLKVDEVAHPTRHPSVTLATEGDGVELVLNFLVEDPAHVWAGEYVILTGYDSITGEFAGWEDGVDRTLEGYDGYTFRLDYGSHETILTVIPEPQTLVLLLGAGGLLRLVRRRKTERV